MTAKDKVMSLEMHKQLGMELKILHGRLNIYFSDENNGGLSKKQIRQKVDRTLNTKNMLTKIRGRMEDLLFKEYPEDANNNIYFGDRPEDFE